jgi:hypothetical protein
MKAKKKLENLKARQRAWELLKNKQGYRKPGSEKK